MRDSRLAPAGSPLLGGARLIASVFGVVFAGIGLTVLGFMWFTPADDFHSPPLFVRIFASFIAIPFVAVGGTLAYGAIIGRSLQSASQAPHHAISPSTAAPAAPGGTAYQCPRCGAPLGENADVSPSGDVKCSFCKAWFNIHRRA